MKTKAAFLILILSLLIISCKKESFPDNEDLKGTWDEITDFLYKEELTFDDEDTLFYFKYWDKSIPGTVDTLLYGLDKNQEKLYLSPIDSPNSESVHKILLNLETGELTIWGLHGSNSESKFKKQ